MFYRLNVIPIHIPPLRERREDIELLTQHFVSVYCAKLKTPAKELSEQAMSLLKVYLWPGNVRELENTIERAVLLNRSSILEVADLPAKLRSPEPVRAVAETEPATPTLESIEKAYIHYVMSQTDGKKADAARILGIDISTLYRKLQRYGMKDVPFSSSDKQAIRKGRK